MASMLGLNLGHTGGRRVLSPLHHPCSALTGLFMFDKQQKDGLTLQKQTCQPMIKENWETHDKKKLDILQKVCEILFFPDQDLGRGGHKYLLKYYLALCMVQFYLLPSPRATLGQVQPFRPRSGELFEAVLSRAERGWGK